MGGGGKDEVEYVVGYQYSLGMHMILCHTPIDAITAIRAGEDYLVWEGSVQQGSISIDLPDLFGGKESEGGVTGVFDIESGLVTQLPNDYLVSVLGAGNVPGNRGVVGVVLRKVYLGDNPYLKTLSYRARHTEMGWQAGTANINGDMNPAHIIYECVTNSQWGMGYAATDCDQTAFIAAANTLYNESLGLSMQWNTSISINDFISEVLKHIDGVFYLDHETGLFTLKLLRYDYDPATITSITEAQVKQVVSYKRRNYAEMANCVVLKYQLHSTLDDVDASITVHNIASIQKMGQIVTHEVNLPGISKASVANNVAWRELKKISYELSSITLLVQPSVGWGLKVGDVFSFSWPDYGITSEVFRVLNVDYGTLQKGEVRIEAMQDIFATAVALYADPPASLWVSPYSLPLAVSQQKLTERTYWALIRRIGQYSSIWSEIDDDAGYMEGYFAKPTGDSYNFRLYTRPATSGDFDNMGNAYFTPTALVATAINKSVTSMTVKSPVDLRIVELGTYAYVGDEIVQVESISLTTNVITIKRGVLDTVPADHAVDARVWFAGTLSASDNIENIAGTTLNAKACTKTSLGTLEIGDASIASYVFNSRYIRPYPPGKFQINGSYYPAYITGALSFSWAHRDRLQQTVTMIAQSENSIGPEVGTTYSIKIYNELGVLIKSLTGQNVTSFAYTLADEITDSGLGRPNESMRVELWSSRTDAKGTYESWQHQDHVIPECRGYGMFYGAYYGE